MRARAIHSAGQAVDARPQGRKRVFFGLALAAVFLMGIVSAAAVFLVDPRLRQISPALVVVVAAAMVLGLGYLLSGVVLAALTTVEGRWILPGKGKRRSWAARVMLPVTVFLGRLVGISREEVQRSFLEVNNALAGAKALKRLPRDARILILLPHCLQNSDCRIRVTSDIENCKSCGQCDLGQFREMLEEVQGVQVAVATGGGVAREIVKKTRPQVIVAVACERDLTHGICDVSQIPVVGVLNRRPYGPCYDTCVDVALIRRAVDQIRKTDKPVN